MGGEGWIQDLKWRRPFLFDYELVIFSDLQYVIRGFTPSVESDMWRWCEWSDEVYFVSYAYSGPLA